MHARGNLPRSAQSCIVDVEGRSAISEFCSNLPKTRSREEMARVISYALLTVSCKTMVENGENVLIRILKTMMSKIAAKLDDLEKLRRGCHRILVALWCDNSAIVEMM